MKRRCLCCHHAGSEKELAAGYHAACSRALFQTARPPTIPFSTPEVAAQARKMVGRMSISGVQPKLSLAHARKGATACYLQSIRRAGRPIDTVVNRRLRARYEPT